MNNNHNGSRRRFIKHSGALTAASIVGTPLLVNLSAMADAAAATSGTYKALVCIYLGGGNDAFGTVFPGDSTTWNTYTQKRDTLLSSREAYHTIAKSPSDGTPFKLHPKLTEVAGLFNARKLSIVGNVGPLRVPTDRLGFSNNAIAKPPKLFSHNDQSSIWLTGMPEGAAEGWGGAALVKTGKVSKVSTDANSVFAGVGVGTTPAFLAARSSTFTSEAQDIKPFGFGAGGALPLCESYETGDLFNCFDTSALTKAWGGDYRALTHEMQIDLVGVTKRSHWAWGVLRNEGLAPINTQGDFRSPDDSTSDKLEKQLRAVAGMIKASGSTAIKAERQVFFVQLGGFDTHTDQFPRQERLLTELSKALEYFDTLLGDDRNKVTTFTASDFGRKLHKNNAGTDHGWGGHHFVMGGVLSGGKGGKVLGHFPDLTLDANGQYTDAQMMADGTLIPKVPVTSYLKPIAEWFGVPDFDGMWKQLDKEITLPQAAFPVISFA